MNTVAAAVDPAAIRKVLYADPVWAAYALADLQPGFFDACTWLLQPQGEPGLVMLYRALTPPVLFAMGPGAAVDAALPGGAACLPPRVYLSILPEHEASVGRWYDLQPARFTDRRPMLRMVLRRPPAGRVAPLTSGEHLVPLHPDDAPRLHALYAHGGDYAPDAFDAGQIANGVFYAVVGPDGALRAAGGTHVVDWDAGIAAIGNFYTLPAHRRMGYAGVLLRAIVADLRAGNVDTIVLNVDQRNSNAAALYERHGFVIHAPFVEGEVDRLINDNW